MRDWDAPKLADLPPAVGARVAGLPLTVCFTSPAGVVEMAHGIGTDDMNQLRSDSYGYGLEMNGAWRHLLASGRANVVVKGHTHRREVFYRNGVVVVDGGTLLSYGPPNGVMVDLDDRCYAMVEVNGVTVAATPWAPLPVAEPPGPIERLTIPCP